MSTFRFRSVARLGKRLRGFLPLAIALVCWVAIWRVDGASWRRTAHTRRRPGRRDQQQTREESFRSGPAPAYCLLSAAFRLPLLLGGDENAVRRRDLNACLLGGHPEALESGLFGWQGPEGEYVLPPQIGPELLQVRAESEGGLGALEVRFAAGFKAETGETALAVVNQKRVAIETASAISEDRVDGDAGALSFVDRLLEIGIQRGRGVCHASEKIDAVADQQNGAAASTLRPVLGEIGHGEVDARSFIDAAQWQAQGLRGLLVVGGEFPGNAGITVGAVDDGHPRRRRQRPEEMAEIRELHAERVIARVVDHHCQVQPGGVRFRRSPVDHGTPFVCLVDEHVFSGQRHRRGGVMAAHNSYRYLCEVSRRSLGFLRRKRHRARADGGRDQEQPHQPDPSNASSHVYLQPLGASLSYRLLDADSSYSGILARR